MERLLQLNFEEFRIISNVNDDEGNQANQLKQIELYKQQISLLEQSGVIVNLDMDCIHHKPPEGGDNFLKSQLEI